MGGLAQCASSPQHRRPSKRRRQIPGSGNISKELSLSAPTLLELVHLPGRRADHSHHNTGGAQHQRITHLSGWGGQTIQVDRHVGHHLLPRPLPGIEFGLTLPAGHLDFFTFLGNFLLRLERGGRNGSSRKTRIGCSEQHLNSAECQSPMIDLGKRGKTPGIDRTAAHGNLIRPRRDSG